jgi:hypothetical protein
MSKLVVNETPAGLINWVNKVFTFINDIDEMVTLVFDWTEYTDFVVNSLNKKQITLVDAPIYALYADYYPLTSEITEDTTITFWDIKTKVWSLLWQKSTSTTYSDTIVWDAINEIARKVLKGRVRSLLDPNKTYRAGKLWFLENKTNIRIKSWWILSEALDLWDITALCDTTYILSSWYVEIWRDLINYTSIDTTGLLGVSWQTIWHLIWEKIVQLYEMPVAMDKPNKVLRVIWNKEYEIPLYTGQESVYYQIIRTWTKILFKIVWLSNDDLVSVEYVSKFINMGSNATENPLPETYWISVLAYLTAGELGYNTGLTLAERVLNTAYSNLQEMYQDYTNETNVIKQSIKPRSYKFNSIRRR